MSLRFTLWAIAVLLMHSSFVGAQTPINAPGAMQPSTGTGVWHVMPMYREFGPDPTSDIDRGRETILLSQAAYGLAKDVSIQFDAPLVYRDLMVGPGSEIDDSDFGLADSTLLLKYRLFQNDPAPTETTRFSIIGGIQIPGDVEFEMDSSNDAWDPIFGGVFSTVRGRHGFNADLLYEIYTGNDDELPDKQSDSIRYDASYLYRLSPEQYTSETTDALYGVLELNGFYGTNGDHEIYLSPGLMLESRTFTLDLTVMLPVHQEVDYRAESDFLIGVGVRLSF